MISQLDRDELDRVMKVLDEAGVVDRDELARTQSALDSCYETIHAARKELGLSLRETSHIPSAIRALKRKDA